MRSRVSQFESRLYLPDGNRQDVEYIPSKEDFRLMSMAVREAKLGISEGNPGVGAVLATGKRTPNSVFAAHSTEITDDDLAAHAEMNAYRMARYEFGRDLSSMSAYTTLDPCPMCTSIFVQGHIGKIIVAAKYEEVPEFVRERKLDLDKRLCDAGRTILVVYGVLNEEAKELMVSENKFH